MYRDFIGLALVTEDTGEPPDDCWNQEAPDNDYRYLERRAFTGIADQGSAGRRQACHQHYEQAHNGKYESRQPNSSRRGMRIEQPSKERNDLREEDHRDERGKHHLRHHYATN